MKVEIAISKPASIAATSRCISRGMYACKPGGFMVKRYNIGCDATGQMPWRAFRAGQRRDDSLPERAAAARAAESMVFGHNSNLKIGALMLHVQTEDRGVAHGLIDTTVYCHGRVLHRRTSNYFDLLPLDHDRQQALKLRLDEQHRMVIEEIRSGALRLNVSTLVASPGCDAQERPAAAEVAKPPAASRS